MHDCSPSRQHTACFLAIHNLQRPVHTASHLSWGGARSSDPLRIMAHSGSAVKPKTRVVTCGGIVVYCAAVVVGDIRRTGVRPGAGSYGWEKEVERWFVEVCWWRG